MKPPPKWAVFISGRGSNLKALLEALGPEVDLVVSSKASAFGLIHARHQNCDTLILPKETHWDLLSGQLRERGVQVIFLAGFMRMVPADFVRDWEGRILNVHPSLLPAYPGLRAIEKSYQEGAAMGVTVHEVTAELDAGPVVLQKQTLPESPTGKHSLTFEQASLLIHRAEQELVRKAAKQWRAALMS